MWFDGYRLDTYRLTLWRGRRPLPLRPQAVRLLALLARRHGELVSHDEIRRALWGAKVIGYDAGIHACVREIRAALGDRADSPRFIATLPREGYRFLRPVGAAPSPSDARPGRDRRIGIAGAACVSVGLLAGLGLLLRPASDPSVAPAALRPVLQRAALIIETAQSDVELQDAVELLEGSPAIANDPTGLTLLARGHAALHRPRAARRAARRAIERQPDGPQAHRLLADLALFERNEPRRAVEHYRRAERLDPRNADLQRALALALLVAGEHSAALERIDYAAQLDPAGTLLSGQHGRIRYLAGDLSGAVCSWSMALARAPERALLHLRLSDAYRASGADAVALAHANRYLELGGAQAPFATAQAYFESLRSGVAAAGERPLVQALAQIRAGDAPASLRELARCATTHCAGLSVILMDPLFAPLDSAAAFQRLVRGANARPARGPPAGECRQSSPTGSAPSAWRPAQRATSAGSAASAAEKSTARPVSSSVFRPQMTAGQPSEIIS